MKLYVMNIKKKLLCFFSFFFIFEKLKKKGTDLFGTAVSNITGNDVPKATFKITESIERVLSKAKENIFFGKVHNYK